MKPLSRKHALSDILLTRCEDTYFCDRCRLGGYRSTSKTALLTHLVAHRKAGHLVTSETIEAVRLDDPPPHVDPPLEPPTPISAKEAALRRRRLRPF